MSFFPPLEIKDAKRLKKLIKEARSGPGLKRSSLEELTEDRIRSKQQWTMASHPLRETMDKVKRSYSPAAQMKATISHSTRSDNAVQRLPVTVTA